MYLSSIRVQNRVLTNINGHFNTKLCCLQIRANHTRKSIYKTEEAKKFRFYIISQYVDYVKKYTQIIDKRFPQAKIIYQTFTLGFKEFMRDLKKFVTIVRTLNSGKKCENLTRNEIELYHQMPKDMRKISPVLLLSALPFASYALFPLMYVFPRQLLTSHFWTLQQKVEFNTIILQNRLKHNKPVFRCLQAELETLRGHRLYEKWAFILGQMGSGVQPSHRLIIECKDLFMSEPYHLFYLKRNHVRHLLMMHDIHLGWFRRVRLADRAVILKEMDKAIVREGGVHNLSTENLRKACLIRGLNPANMRTEDMINWLNQWIEISNAVDKETLSLLLHCPILLAYNEPSNWILIYPEKCDQMTKKIL